MSYANTIILTRRHFTAPPENRKSFKPDKLPCGLPRTTPLFPFLKSVQESVAKITPLSFTHAKSLKAFAKSTRSLTRNSCSSKGRLRRQADKFLYTPDIVFPTTCAQKTLNLKNRLRIKFHPCFIYKTREITEEILIYKHRVTAYLRDNRSNRRDALDDIDWRYTCHGCFSSKPAQR